MQDQLKTVSNESIGKSSSKVSTALDELQYLINFNASITQAAANTMEHLTEFVFISMGNLTLACRDAYLTHLKSGVKPDTIASFRQLQCIFQHFSRTISLRRLRRKLHTLKARDIHLLHMARVGTISTK